jgi:hypothetical protein
MSEAMHTGQLMLLDGLPYADKLRRELGAHHREMRERMTIVEKKDRIKAALGHLQLAPRSSRPAAQFGLRGQPAGGVVVQDVPPARRVPRALRVIAQVAVEAPVC